MRYLIALFFLLSIFFALPTAINAQTNTGCVRGDCLNGNGVWRFRDGGRYEGDFQGGLRHGEGVMRYQDGTKYMGHWEENLRTGRGRMIFANGNVYFGGFFKDMIDGQGRMEYKNGNSYEGEWIEGEPHGTGIFTFVSSERYEGDFEDGLFTGHGIMIYADGSRYEGEWLENRRQGLGTLYQTNGEQLSGQWENNEYLSDWGRLAYSGDTTSLRNCNLMQCSSGKGKFTYQDGTRYYGDFNQGIPEGIGSVYFFSGDRYEGGWFRHAPHGKGVMYYANGRVVGAIWDRGQLVQELFTSQQEMPVEIAVETSDEVKVWAVVVGAARYTHMPVLRYTDDDAYQLYAFLKSPEGGALPNHQLQLLIDEDATHQAIMNAMRQVFLRADENDMILFYFSGHGLQGAFLPVDYDGFDNRLEHSEISDILRQSRAKHKLVLADACHAGSLIAARAPLNVTLQSYYDALNASSGGTALLMSSKGEEYSLEDRGLRSGIFSHFLIRGLNGEANSNGDNLVTVRELYNYVHQRVRQYTGNVQTPTLSGDFDDNMPVSVIRH